MLFHGIIGQLYAHKKSAVVKAEMHVHKHPESQLTGGRQPPRAL